MLSFTLGVKRLRPNDLATWELRLGDLRVYNEVEETPAPRVLILAVGVKVGNQVYIGGRRFEL